MFFTQSPSFLGYPLSLEQTQGDNNARTLFGVHEIPSDNQIRSLPGTTPPSAIKPAHASLFNALERAGAVDAHRSVNGTLPLAFGGTEHFSSQAIHCGCCSARRHANGTTMYFHSALAPHGFLKKID